MSRNEVVWGGGEGFMPGLVYLHGEFIASAGCAMELLCTAVNGKYFYSGGILVIGWSTISLSSKN